jgi:hypothetical protein
MQSFCHGTQGKGGHREVKDRRPDHRRVPGEESDGLTKAFLDGVKTEKGTVKKEREPFKDDLTPEPVDALIAMIRSFKK